MASQSGEPSAPSTMAKSNAQTQENAAPHQCQNNLETLDKTISNTLKRNPKMELSKTDLLKLLGQLEGELQARDIVIATLKSEKLKYFLSSRYLSGTSDPHAALARDVAITGGVIGYETSHIEQQAASLEALVAQQRRMHSRMAKILKDAELRHRAVIKELEEEKRKHEHDTAQGDDITYGLEKERTRLKKELELENQEKKRLELELKKATDQLEEDKTRQKQIVLLLLAERKKIIMKYIEERKRSEDLAQILSEEKVRIDSMAEGLEEESKKSLQMEAELEKQLAQFDMERQQYRQALAKEEKRAREFEAELEKARAELEAWKESAGGRRLGSTPPPPPAKPANLVPMPTIRPVTAPQTIKGAILGTGTPMVSSKVVQPTATVSSVPVSGPTIGIARSVTPGQTLRGVGYTTNVGPSVVQGQQEATATVAAAPPSETQKELSKEKRAPGPGTAGKLVPAGQASGKLAGFHVAASPGGAVVAAVVPPAGMLQKKPVSRGVPPPVPPNKPVVPPKKEAVYLRRPELAQQQQQQQQQEAGQKGKQPPAGQNTGPLVQQAIAAFNQPSDEEAKPR